MCYQLSAGSTIPPGFWKALRGARMKSERISAISALKIDPIIAEIYFITLQERQTTIYLLIDNVYLDFLFKVSNTVTRNLKLNFITGNYMLLLAAS